MKVTSISASFKPLRPGWFAIGLSLAAIAGLACGALSPTSTAQPTGLSPADFGGMFQAPSNAAHVDLSEDSARKAATVIGSDGGSLEATAADGTSFTLSIPDGALVADQEVTLIPLSLANPPIGGELIGAVMIQPLDLFLFDFATLVIDPPNQVPVSEQIPVAFRGDGADFRLQSPDLDTNSISIRLLRFGGYAAIRGSQKDWSGLVEKLPADPEARFLHLLASLTIPERVHRLVTSLPGGGHTAKWIASAGSKPRLRPLAGPEADFTEDSAELLRQYLENVLRPMLSGEVTSCAQGQQIIQAYLSYERQRQLLGLASQTEDVRVDASRFGDNYRLKCYEEAYEKCEAEHDLAALIILNLTEFRQAAVLGVGDVAGIDALAKPFFDRCYRFELEFISVAGVESGDGGYESTVSARVSLRLPAGSDLFSVTTSASAPLVNEAFEWRAMGCQFDGVRGGGEFHAVELRILFAGARVSGLELYYDPGQTSESATGQCGLATVNVPRHIWWTVAYASLHGDEVNGSVSGAIYRAADWQILGGSLYAQKGYVRTTGAAHEDTTLNLIHVPGE